MLEKSLDKLNPYKDKVLKKLLLDCRVFTLSSDNDMGFGSCPLYFAYYNGGLVFISSPNSHHIKMAKDTSSASVYVDSKNPLSICGLQLKGNIRLANKDEQNAYFDKYPFVRLLKLDLSLKDGLSLDNKKLADDFIKKGDERFYAFKILAAKLSYNAFKEKIVYH